MADLILYLDEVDSTAVWWAESPEVPGFTAAAGSLAEVRRLAAEALPGADLTERLDAPEHNGIRLVVVGLPT